MQPEAIKAIGLKKSKLRRNKNLFKIKTKIPKGFKKNSMA